jgi:hypothetical protein
MSDVLIAVFSGLTAVGTVSMAVATLVVVIQGRRQREDFDRRHRDSFRPLCVLAAYDGVDPQYRRDTLLAIAEQALDQGFGIVEIKCALRNVGAGPAVNVKIMFRFADMNGHTTPAWELSPLGAGECRGGANDPLRVPIKFESRFNKTDYSQIPGKLWEIVLIYEDIFGSAFYSVHHKRPLQVENLYRSPDGPGFVAPPQPWVTFGKGEPPT